MESDHALDSRYGTRFLRRTASHVAGKRFAIPPRADECIPQGCAGDDERHRRAGHGT